MARRATARDRTALHEAGHVVMAFDQRIPLYSVTIREDADSFGTVTHGNPLRRLYPSAFSGSSLRRRAAFEALARVSLAGAEAVRRVAPRKANEGAEEDFSKVVDVVMQVTSSTEEAEAYVRLLTIQTRSILELPIHWHAVEAVAAALLEHETLSGRAVRKVIKEAHAAFFRSRMPPAHVMPAPVPVTLAELLAEPEA